MKENPRIYKSGKIAYTDEFLGKQDNRIFWMGLWVMVAIDIILVAIGLLYKYGYRFSQG